mgnify:CR=1 FL=1
MNFRKKCAKMTGLILAIAVGLLLTGALFHQTFCTDEPPTLTSLGGDTIEEQEPSAKRETKKEKKKTKRRKAKRKENIRSQQSKIKERLIKLDQVLDRKLEKIRRLRHHDRSAAATTGTDTKPN